MADSPRLVSLRTAVPDYPVNQADAARRAGHLFQAFPEVLRLLPVFDNTGIETRYSCVPIGWYTEPHGWKERTELYLKHSVDLLERVLDCTYRETLPQANATLAIAADPAEKA